MIRPEIQALVDRGEPIPLDAYLAMRMNSWEREAIIPLLTDEALCATARQVLDNCQHNPANTSRPCVTYDQILAVVLAPLLIKRLERGKP